MRHKICLALDVDTIQEAEDLVKRLSPWVGLFKVGAHLFAGGNGKKIINAIHSSGADVFLDLKYHDIPNTVANAARVVTRMGVSMFNLHASGGAKMMQTVAEAVSDEAILCGVKKPIVLGVTLLTSISQQELSDELLVNVTINDYIEHLAKLAQQSGLGGIVCSPREISLVRKACGDSFVIVTPGIRPTWAVAKDDQTRVTTPKEAIDAGTNYIVVGRPIIKAKNPEAAAKALLNEIGPTQ